MLALGIAAAGSGVVVLAAAAPASAAISNSCNNNNTCFFYAANLGGARAAFDTGNEPDLLGYYFPGPGAGAGTPVGNNSASARNTYFNKTLIVFYSPAFRSGPTDTLSPRSQRNLGATANNNRSFRISE